MPWGVFEDYAQGTGATLASRLILVGFSSHDPQLAALVANTIAQTFIEDTFQTRHNAIMKSSEWLSRQLDDIRTKMETSSKALAEFQGSIGVADVDGDKSTYTEHMGELSRQYTRRSRREFRLRPCSKTCKGESRFAARSPQQSGGADN